MHALMLAIAYAIKFLGNYDMPHLVRIVIQLPVDLKTQLDNLKQQGYTTSGFIRAMLEREFAKMEEKPASSFQRETCQ